MTHRTSIPDVVLPIFLILSMSCPAATAGADGDVLDVQGHRGWRGRYPENTMAAFRAAIELGVPTLELDVQVTRDRVPVVYHDPKLNPALCVHEDGSAVERRRISEMRLAELAEIDCGSRTARKFPEQQAVPGQRIPRLDQVLGLAGQASYPVRVSIEIKMQDERTDRSAEELAALVVESVRAHGMERRTIVQSFRPEALRAVAELAPEIDRAILVRSPGDYDRKVEQARATILSPRRDGLTRSAVRRFQQRGIAVVPWTVNQPRELERFVDWGVDGVITDYPERALEISARHSGDSR